MLRAQPYRVIESESFLDQINQVLDPETWDRIKVTIDLDLARDPDAFEFVAQIGGMAVRAVGLLLSPPQVLVFLVDDGDECITLLGLLP